LAAADGAIKGVVSDPSGAVVPGASVELRTSSGALIEDTHTDGAGAYAFDGLGAGTFVIEVPLRISAACADRACGPPTLCCSSSPRSA